MCAVVSWSLLVCLCEVCESHLTLRGSKSRHEKRQIYAYCRVVPLQRSHLPPLSPTAWLRAAPPQALRAVRATLWLRPPPPLLSRRQPPAPAIWHSRPSPLLLCMLRPTPPHSCPMPPHRCSLRDLRMVSPPASRSPVVVEDRHKLKMERPRCVHPRSLP